MKKAKLLAFLLALVMVLSAIPISGLAVKREYEWWDLRGYTEQEYNSSVADTSSPFAGWRDLVGTYGENGPELTVRHYWGWYVEKPNSTRQRIDIYVPSHATKNSPIYHMVNNTSWTNNFYPYNAPRYNAETGVFTPGNNTSANALSRGYIVMTSGARTYGPPSDETGKSPATFADSKAALRFLRANMGPDKAIKVGNPELAFVTGFSGGGALANILGASGNSPDYFAAMYEIGALGLEWVSSTPFEEATLAQKTDAANWSNTISDAYLGVVSWAGMDDFQMGEQALAWFTSEKRWRQPLADAKTPAIMTTGNSMALEYVDYVNDLGLMDETGEPLIATYTIKDNEEKGGIAGGSFLDATVRLMEGSVVRALNIWKTGKQTDFDAAPLEVSDPLDPLWNMESSAGGFMGMGAYDYALVNESVLINDETPTEDMLKDPSQLPENPTVQISDYTAFTLGLTYGIDKKSIFAYSSPSFGFMPLDPSNWVEIADTAGLYGADDQPANVTHKVAWDMFIGDSTAFPRIGKQNTGMEWEEYLNTEAGQKHALQIKMASSMPYLNAKYLHAFPYLADAGIYGSDVTEPARYWFARFGMNDQSCSFSMRTMLYYSLMRNDAVDFDMCDLDLFVWSKPHAADYENVFPWIDKVVAHYTASNQPDEEDTYPWWLIYNNVVVPDTSEGDDFSDGDMANFKLSGAYHGYPDVDESKWYGAQNAGVIRDVTLLGIMLGDESGAFRPEDGVRLSEVIKMAAVVYNTYYGSPHTFNQNEGAQWYDTYVNFAVEHGIMKAGEFSDYEKFATRAEMAYIFANALPAEELRAISALVPPDVKETDKYGAEILRLYAAGVLTGNDALGTFTPERSLTRAEAAAIITRIALPAQRVVK